MTKKRIAIVGLGDYATSLHIPVILSSAIMEIVAVESKDPKDVAAWSQKLGVKGYTDFETLLKEVKPDFVILAVYHNQYLPLVRLAAAYNIPVFKEKPIAQNVKEAKELVEIVQKSGIPMMFGTQRRFAPAFQKFAELVKTVEGIHYLEARGALGFAFPWEGWRTDKEISGGGVMHDWGYHLIDILLWNFGLPESVVALFANKSRQDSTYDVEDTASVLLKYKDKIGSIFISRTLPKSEYYRVVGFEKVVEYENGIVRVKDIKGNTLEEHNLSVAKTEFVKGELAYFCDVLDGNKKLEEDATYHLQHIAVIEAAYLSEKEKRFVSPEALLA